MTNPSVTPTLRLPPPAEQTIYQQLATDFYPWTELLIDLERRLSPQFSAVLDIQQAASWARFVWSGGVLRGGIGGGGHPVDLATAMRGLPRAHLTLTEVAPQVADIIWNCRALAPKPLQAPWPAAVEELSRQRFFGALISGPHCSFWENGNVITGPLPQAGAVCFVVSALSQVDRTGVLNLWRDLIALTQQTAPNFSEAWRQVSMQLSAEHAVLDPFANEISVKNGQLRIAPEISVEEFRPALLAAYQASLTRIGLRLADLPITSLQSNEAWAAAGLENL